MKMRIYPCIYWGRNVSVPRKMPTAYTVTILKESIVQRQQADDSFVRAEIKYIVMKIKVCLIIKYNLKIRHTIYINIGFMLNSAHYV